MILNQIWHSLILHFVLFFFRPYYRTTVSATKSQENLHDNQRKDFSLESLIYKLCSTIIRNSTLTMDWVGWNYSRTQTTDSFEQRSSSEATSCSASTSTPSLLWDPKVHYCVRKSAPMDPKPTHRSSVYVFTTQFRKHQFFEYNFVRISHLFHNYYTPKPFHRLVFITLITSGKYHKLLSPSLHNIL
jgi:hypothetical protein